MEVFDESSPLQMETVSSWKKLEKICLSLLVKIFWTTAHKYGGRPTSLEDGPQVIRTVHKSGGRPKSVEDDPQDWTTAHKSNSFAFEHSGCFHARIIQIPNDDPTSMFTCPIEQWTRTRTGSFLACVQSLGHVSRFQPLLS